METVEASDLESLSIEDPATLESHEEAQIEQANRIDGNRYIPNLLAIRYIMKVVQLFANPMIHVCVCLFPNFLEHKYLIQKFSRRKRCKQRYHLVITRSRSL